MTDDEHKSWQSIKLNLPTIGAIFAIANVLSWSLGYGFRYFATEAKIESALTESAKNFANLHDENIFIRSQLAVLSDRIIQDRENLTKQITEQNEDLKQAIAELRIAIVPRH